jgi:hypothetical protein
MTLHAVQAILVATSKDEKINKADPKNRNGLKCYSLYIGFCITKLILERDSIWLEMFT